MKLAGICAMQSAVPCPGLGLFLLSAVCVGKRIQIQQRSGSRGHQAGTSGEELPLGTCKPLLESAALV